MGAIGRYLDRLTAEERDRVIETTISEWRAYTYGGCLVGIAAGVAADWDDAWDPENVTAEVQSRLDDHRRRHDACVTLGEWVQVTMFYRADGTNITSRLLHLIRLEDKFDAAYRRAMSRGTVDGLIRAIKLRAAKPHQLVSEPPQQMEAILR